MEEVIAKMSEWDPWKRFERERERRMWDPYYRLEYQREKEQWDPFYRYERQRKRYYTDPWYRFERDMDRLSWDPWYRELKRREWKYDNGAMFKDRVLLPEEREEIIVSKKSGDSSRIGGVEKSDLWYIIEAKSRAGFYGPSWWDYLKIVLGLGFAGWLVWLGWSLMTFRLPLP